MTVAAIAAAATVLGWSALLPSRLRAWPSARPVLGVGLVGVLVAVAVVGSLDVLPWRFLKEGRELTVLAQLGAPDPFLGRWGPEAEAPVLGVVRAHLVEAVAFVVLVLASARAVLPWGAALATTVALLASPWLAHAAVSEGPAMPIALLSLLAMQAATAANGPESWQRWVAAGSVGAAALAAAVVREEWAVLGVPATLAASLAAADPARWAAWRARWRASPPGLAVLGALAVTSLGLYALDAVAPLLPVDVSMRTDQRPPWTAWHWASLRVVDLFGFLPLGGALLVLWGAWRLAGRGPLVWIVGAAAVMLVRVYGLASHLGEAPYETLRYLASLLGVFAVAGIAGARWCHRAGARPWLWGVVAVTAVLPRLTAPPEVRGGPLALVTTTQTEGARWWVAARAAAPDCLFATRLAVRVADATGPQHAWTYDWQVAYVGGPLGWSTPAVGDEALRARIPGLVPRGDDRLRWARGAAPCLRFSQGLDCQLRGADCAGWVDGWPAAAQGWVDVPEHNRHHGGRDGPMRLEIRVDPSAAPATRTPPTRP